MNRKLAEIILRVSTELRGQPLWECYKFLKKSQFWEPDLLKELQELKLELLIHHCFKYVPFYQKWFKENQAVPSDIKIDNLNLLPVIEKKDYLESQKVFISKNYKKKPYEYAKTSGSTGIPLIFPKSLKASAFQLAALYRGHSWHGVKPGEKEARFWGIPLERKEKNKSRIKDTILNRFRENEYNLSKDTLMSFYKKIINHKADYLMGYTSMISQFAYFLYENCIDARKLNLKMIKCTSETIGESDRMIVEKVFGKPIVSEYGAAEAGIISFQCEAGNQHLTSESCIVEFEDPKDTTEYADLKEVIVTNLDNFAQPIIRYRIGDYALPSKKYCDCGKMLPILNNIVGRTEDIIRNDKNQKWPSTILDFLLKGLALKDGSIKQYKVYQNKIDRLDFILVPGKEFSQETDKEIRNKCHEIFGNTIKIKIKTVEKIDREKSGKFRDFVSNISD